MGDAIGTAGDEEGGERLRRGIDDRSRSMREQGVGGKRERLDWRRLSRGQTSRKKLFPFRVLSREVWNITLGICMETATF